jgi:TatA/E family protein of Tat protein translocase
MPSLGPLEIVVIMVVALLVFGPNKLPEVGRQVGRGLRELRKLQDTVRDELHDVMRVVDDSASSATPPTIPPVVSPPGTGATSISAPTPDASARPGPSGAHAPSRFRAPNR